MWGEEAEARVLCRESPVLLFCFLLPEVPTYSTALPFVGTLRTGRKEAGLLGLAGCLGNAWWLRILTLAQMAQPTEGPSALRTGRPQRTHPHNRDRPVSEQPPIITGKE